MLLGREVELAALSGLMGTGGPRSVVLAGEAGIGKTTLWEAAVRTAQERGLRVLTARASEAERELSFTALIDLAEGLDVEALDAAPAPQRSALEVALLRSAPGEAAPQPHAIGLGLLAALRALAARAPVLLAVDDLQWLDAASADALAFVARRLDGEPIAFLIARRPGRTSALEQALERRGLEHVPVGPLGTDATRRLLHERFGLALSRRLLLRVVGTTQGNPLFAVELGRMLQERGLPRLGEDMPLPPALDELLSGRVAALEPRLGRLLLTIGLAGDLRRSELEAVVDPETVEDALDAELLVEDGERVRPAHPLLPAAAKRRARAQDRRELHAALAGELRDAERRALHLALATPRADAGVAAVAVAADAAAASAARGARAQAVQLGEHAVRLSPPATQARSDAVLALARHLECAGELTRMTELVLHELPGLAPGAARGQAWLRLAESEGVRTVAEYERHFDTALAESGGDPEVVAIALAKKAEVAAGVTIARLADAERWAQEAVAAAADAGADAERAALHGLAWVRALHGAPLDDLSERFAAASSSAAYVTDSPDRVAAQRLVWRGELRAARAELERLLALADEHGEPMSYFLARLHLCELELRVGRWDEAARLLDDWAGSGDRELLIQPMYERCRALLAAGRGQPDDARGWADEALAAEREIGAGWDGLEARRACGIAALLEQDPGRAAVPLRAVWEHTRREGVDEPGVFPVAPELVEALVELEALDEAAGVTERLDELARRLGHPWGAVTSRRCAAVAALAAGTDPDAAAAELERAAHAYEELGLRFDAARTSLALGRAQRRRRKWGEARRVLEGTVAAFEAIGSAGWARRARDELERVGARRRAGDGELTPSERRVVELAAAGRANKEIAQALFITVHTVEAHLTHAYAKLGVRSRSQLAGRLAAAE